MRLLLWICLALPLVGMSQEDGVFFQKGVSWKEILKKAQAEHKNIFVDCSATWCGPCQYMNKKIFPTAEVGKVINESYISVEVQMDSTTKDSPSIKKWYAQASFFKNTYNINAYPTFLILSSAGEPIHKIVGAQEKAKDFLEKIRDADSVDKQYFPLVHHYKEHFGDSAFLAHALIAALKGNDKSSAASICDAYIDCLKSPYLKDNLKFIAAAPLSTNSKGFKLFLEHSTEVDTALGINTAYDLIISIVKKDVVGPLLAIGAPPVNWERLTSELKAIYPRQAERIVMESKLGYFSGRKMWNEYGEAVADLVKNTPQMNAFNLNEAAWSVFSYCEDPEILQQAINWSQRSLAAGNEASNVDYVDYVDTYANLLYKTHHIDEAIIWEQKALSLASIQKKTYELGVFAKNITLMKKGDKTWDTPL